MSESFNPGWIEGVLGLVGTLLTLIAGFVAYHWKKLDKVIDAQANFVTRVEMLAIVAKAAEDNAQRHAQNISATQNLIEMQNNLTARIDRVLERLRP